MPYIQIKGKHFGVCSPIPAALQEVFPSFHSQPASLESLFLFFAVLGRIWVPTRVIWSLVQLPNHSFGNMLSANNKAPFVKVLFPKLGVPVAKLISLLQAISETALFS